MVILTKVEQKMRPTCLAVGWIKSSLIPLAVFVTVDVNQPSPFVNAATGSFCSSPKSGMALLLPVFVGVGELPNPTYLPPWFGGILSGRDAFTSPSRAKYLSSTFILVPDCCGLSVLLVPLKGVPDLLICREPLVGGFAVALAVGWGVLRRSPGTYSLFSAFALSLSFHSSPTSPLYRSEMVASSQVRPRILVSSCSSKNCLHLSFPPSRMRSISPCLKASIVTERTKEICTPRPRCTPAQDRQMKTPNFGEAHCGFGALQSQQLLLLFVFWIARSCKVRAVAALVSKTAKRVWLEKFMDKQQQKVMPCRVDACRGTLGQFSVPLTSSQDQPPTCLDFLLRRHA
jgi:hypothetical protein